MTEASRQGLKRAQLLALPPELFGLNDRGFPSGVENKKVPTRFSSGSFLSDVHLFCFSRLTILSFCDTSTVLSKSEPPGTGDYLTTHLVIIVLLLDILVEF